MLQLCVCEERVQYPEVSVPQRRSGERQIEEIADHDVDQNAKVVGVEILVGGRGREEEVQKFKDQELEGGFACGVGKIR